MTETSLDRLTEYADRVRPRIDESLRACLPLGGGCPGQLCEAMEYGLLAPGKRLRPMLVLLAAEACGSSSERAMPAACAVEMVHAYSLIHDDLPAMDDDDLRRGRPTCHKVFGEAMAILAGDALLALAFETLTTLQAAAEVVVACTAALAEAAGARHLVGGQADDTEGPRPEAGLETLESIHRRKTGALLGVSLRLGALVAGADPASEEALARYGRSLGLAFQITDDLLDVEGDAEAVGKRVGKDAGRGKLTFPGLLGIERSRRRARECVEDACAALAPLGVAAGWRGGANDAGGEASRGALRPNGVEMLAALARFVLERNH